MMSKSNNAQYENVDCILCSSPTHIPVIKKRGHTVNRCQKCSLLYVSPRPTRDSLVDFYNVQRGTGGKKNDVKNQLMHDKHKRKKFEAAIELIKQFNNDVHRIFDLGCSTGIFLGLAAAEGWIPHGSDLDRKAVKQNRLIYGNKVKLQHGDSIKYPDSYFDVVTLFDVIEHLHDPVAVLRETTRVLKTDGLLVVSTPAVDGLLPIITYRIFGKTIGAWEHPTPPGHLFQFSRETLRKTLEKAGFEVINQKSLRIYMPYTVGKLENSIINALKNENNCKKDKCNEGLGIDRSADVNLRDIMPRATYPYSLNKIARLCVRYFSLTLVGAIYPLAKLINAGDAILVIARKSSAWEKKV